MKNITLTPEEITRVEELMGFPMNDWYKKGEKDPHEGKYNDTREKCCAMGDQCVLSLHHAIERGWNASPPMSLVMRGAARMPIAYMTALKENLRWYSRRIQEGFIDLMLIERFDKKLNGYIRGEAWFNHKTDGLSTDVLANFAFLTYDRREGTELDDGSIVQRHEAVAGALSRLLVLSIIYEKLKPYTVEKKYSEWLATSVVSLDSGPYLRRGRIVRIKTTNGSYELKTPRFKDVKTLIEGSYKKAN